MGELFPDGECRPGVQQDGRVCGEESASLAVSAGWTATHETRAIHRRSATRDGVAQVDGHREIPGASHTQKIIVKPCAGKRHARFERGLWKRADYSRYRAIAYQRRKIPFAERRPPRSNTKLMYRPQPTRAKRDSDNAEPRHPAAACHHPPPTPLKMASNPMIPQVLSKIGFVRPKKSFAPRMHKTAQLCITRPPASAPCLPTPRRATVIQGPYPLAQHSMTNRLA